MVCAFSTRTIQFHVLTILQRNTTYKKDVNDLKLIKKLLRKTFITFLIHKERKFSFHLIRKRWFQTRVSASISSRYTFLLRIYLSFNLLHAYGKHYSLRFTEKNFSTFIKFMVVYEFYKRFVAFHFTLETGGKIKNTKIRKSLKLF